MVKVNIFVIFLDKAEKCIKSFLFYFGAKQIIKEK